MITYFSWWYGQGMVDFYQAILVMTGKIYAYFSVTTLVRTLFDPWKRDNYSVENASLQARLKIALDNLLSRLIGFVIRIFTMLFGFFVTIAFFLFTVLILVLWLTLPVVVLFLIINGIRTVLNG